MEHRWEQANNQPIKYIDRIYHYFSFIYKKSTLLKKDSAAAPDGDIAPNQRRTYAYTDAYAVMIHCCRSANKSTHHMDGPYRIKTEKVLTH